jgi:putative FmdB family regulatory protein
VPIYEYRCGDCGEVFEYMQSMSDPARTECERCSGRLERLISASAFQFKGGGWYRDLYASPKKESASGGGEGSGGGAKSSDGGGDKAKPASGGSGSSSGASGGGSGGDGS